LKPYLFCLAQLLNIVRNQGFNLVLVLINYLKTTSMKQLIKGVSFKHFGALLMLCLIQTITWAQDNSGTSGDAGSSSSSSKTSVTTTTTETWYTEPWVWVVGAAVLILILILVALLRGSSGGAATASRTDRVTVTKTTDTDIV
jgi:hypothetical protein